MGFITIFVQLPSKNTYVSVPNGCKTLKKWFLALWILKLFILKCLCSIRFWFGNAVNSEQRNSLYLMIGIWTDWRGCIINIIPNACSSVWRGLLGFISVPLLGLVHWAGGVAISSPCPVWEWSFSSVLFFELQFLFLFLPLVILETLFCARKQINAAILPQEEYWSLTIMQQPSPWDTLLEIRLTMWYGKRNRFDQTAWQNQAQHSFKISTTNCGIGVQ